MVRKILKYGDPLLETVSEPVAEEEFGSAELRGLIGDMFETMYEAQGVGLAAPQVGLLKRLTVIDCLDSDDRPDPRVLINPEIIAKEGQQDGTEGCLSIPQCSAKVRRPARVTVRFRTLSGEWDETEGRDLLARAICHEVDHLDGVLFLKYLGRLKRESIKRKIRSLKKKGEWH